MIPPRPPTPPPDPIDVSTLPIIRTTSISLLRGLAAELIGLMPDEVIKTVSLRKLQELFEELRLSSSKAVEYTKFLEFASKVQCMFGVVKETRTLIFENAEVQESTFGSGNFGQDPLGNNDLEEAVQRLQEALTDAPPTLDAVGEDDWAAILQTAEKQSKYVKPENLDSTWTAFNPLMADKDYLAGSKRKVRDYIEMAHKANVSITSKVTKERTLVGFVYLTPSKAGVKTLIRAAFDPFAPPPCFNIGVALFSSERGWGYGRNALTQMLELAFGDLGAHRVQAHVVDGPMKMTALKVFNGLSFTYEGTQRRAVYSPLFANWKDVTTLAVLDTDWMVHQHLLNLGKTVPGRNLELWDAMFERQEQERANLLKRSDASSE